MTAADDLRGRLAALSPAQRARLEHRLLGAAASTRRVAPEQAEDTVGEVFPLTDVQQAYWAGRSGDFDLGGVATHAYAEIDGAGLNLARLTVAWNRLVARHEMLRAVVQPDGTQRVLAQVPAYAIAIDDLRDLPPAEAQVRLAALRNRMSHQVLPADRWPLFEIRGARIDDRRTRLHLSFDAIVADLTSRRILMREWRALYERDAERPAPSSRFADFAVRQQAGRGEDRYDRAREYWLARLDDLPAPPRLPLEDASSRRPPSVFTRRSRRFGADARTALDRLSRSLGVTLNALLLNAYADTLRLWSETDAFTLNLTLFNRPPDMAEVVGDFTALTLTEIEAPGGAPLSERLGRLQARLWRDIDHRHFNGVRVLRELARRRGGSGPVLMPVVFTSALGGEAETAWLGEETYSVSQTPQVWIDLMIVGDGDGFIVHWNAVEALFPPGMMADMFAAFVGMVDAIAKGDIGGASSWPDIAAASLPIRDREARQKANATTAAAPDRLLHQLWKDHLQTAPGAPAVIAADRILTYAELGRMVTSLAHTLREGGARPNALVAVVMPKGWRQVVAVLAVLEAGGAYLPIDPATPPVRLRQILADGAVETALAQGPQADAAAWPDGVRRLDIDRQDLTASRPSLEPVQAMSDLAYVIYTSGSSGAPKGVAIDHRGAVNTILDINARFGVTARDRVLALSALTFDLSVYDIFGVLAAGGAIVMPTNVDVRDPARWSALMAEHSVTLWNSAPAFMDLLLDHARVDGALGFPALERVLLSGDWVPVSMPDAVRRLASKARVISLGGATEASIWSIFHETAPEDGSRKSIPYGKPLANQTFHVLGPAFIDRPAGAPGELFIGGLGLAQGYWRDADKTAAAFVSHPRTGERLYRTGDFGRYLPDGSIEFLGRRDAQVKVRGFRVELGEIEAVLAGHPGVRAAVAVLNRHGALTAYATLRADAARPSSEMLAAWLNERLPSYMQPSSVTILAALPATANGKLDRAALAALPGAEAVRAQAGLDDEPRLQAILRLAQGACPISIPSPEANLLDLGLTSIDMIRIVNAIEAELGFRPSVDALYRAPTLRDLAGDYASWLATGGRPVGAAVVGADRRGDVEQAKGARPAMSGAAAAPLPPASPVAALQALTRARRSVRRFTLRPAPVADLSRLLGSLRKDAETGRFAYGSASGLYPVQACLYVRSGRVAGLARGAYHYDPVGHALRPLPASSRLPRSAFSHLQNAPIFDEAAFVLFLVADLGEIERLYPGHGLHFATLEAGLMTQLLELAAPDCGLGLCQAGQADAAAVSRLLHLTESHRLLHTVFGGEPDLAEANLGPDAALETAQLRRLIERVMALGADEAKAAREALEADRNP